MWSRPPSCRAPPPSAAHTTPSWTSSPPAPACSTFLMQSMQDIQFFYAKCKWSKIFKSLMQNVRKNASGMSSCSLLIWSSISAFSSCCSSRSRRSSASCCRRSCTWEELAILGWSGRRDLGVERPKKQMKIQVQISWVGQSTRFLRETVQKLNSFQKNSQIKNYCEQTKRQVKTGDVCKKK